MPKTTIEVHFPSGPRFIESEFDEEFPGRESPCYLAGWKFECTLDGTWIAVEDFNYEPDLDDGRDFSGHYEP